MNNDDDDDCRDYNKWIRQLDDCLVTNSRLNFFQICTPSEILLVANSVHLTNVHIRSEFQKHLQQSDRCAEVWLYNLLRDSVTVVKFERQASPTTPTSPTTPGNDEKSTYVLYRRSNNVRTGQMEEIKITLYCK